MKAKTTIQFRRTLAGAVVFSLAGSLAQARDETPGYLVDSWGNISRSSSGECVHTSDWKPELASIVGCDGVTLDAKVVTVRGEGSGILAEVTMPSTALFAFNSADLTAEGKQTIESYRETLMPKLAEAYAGIVIGHTDSTGDAKYNHGLSERRAKAVRDYLVNTGTPTEKLRVVGRGESEPIASNETKDGRTRNRRVEVVVIGEVRALDAMRFPSVTLFPRRSAELTPQGKQMLEKQRNIARNQLARASYIEIIGHTDDVGDDAYNQDLSEKRAQNVFNYLAETGMDVSKVTVLGMGEHMPIANNNTPEGRAENRRVEILLLGRRK
ncbi:MAG: OmpA family protein [Gammaproteobacteria bacterium]|nr:OmpA family protein [Gammaproteobacteria bacterium]MCP4982036.1 OmpA family protein [Gammaproteobacteria bacterium]